jgi:DNA polymerase IV
VDRVSAPYDPVVLHADMDAFYASVEQRDHPELRGRPVMVGGTSDRGVVTAASYEARRFGVHSAMPTAEARARCPDGVFLRGDMAKYRREGLRLRTVFASVSPAVEPLSLDEAFVDVTASVALLGAPREIGALLRARVWAATGLAVTVGIGPGKMIAKIASDVAKPDGLLEVPPAAVESFLAPLAVERLWGVGPVTGATLRRAGLETVGDLARCSLPALAAVVGTAAAGHLVRLARGTDPRPVESDRAARSYGEEGTFAEDTLDDRRVRGAIIAHAEAVARRLRHDGMRAAVVVLKVKLGARRARGRFPLFTRRTTLAAPTDDGQALSEAALGLWERHRPPRPVRLIGVAASGIVDAGGEQLALLPAGATLRRAALNRALDHIVARFGSDSIGRGAVVGRAGLTRRWKPGEDDGARG